MMSAVSSWHWTLPPLPPSLLPSQPHMHFSILHLRQDRAELNRTTEVPSTPWFSPMQRVWGAGPAVLGAPGRHGAGGGGLQAVGHGPCGVQLHQAHLHRAAGRREEGHGGIRPHVVCPLPGAPPPPHYHPCSILLLGQHADMASLDMDMAQQGFGTDVTGKFDRCRFNTRCQVILPRTCTLAHLTRSYT